MRPKQSHTSLLVYWLEETPPLWGKGRRFSTNGGYFEQTLGTEHIQISLIPNHLPDSTGFEKSVFYAELMEIPLEEL